MGSQAAPLLNCIVLGASYVGGMVTEELTKTLPKTHRVVVVEKSSHFQHLFTFPRFAVSGGSEHKAFIPLRPTAPNLHLHAAALFVSPTVVQLDRPISLDGKQVTEIPYDALVLATGTKLAQPGNMPGEDKVSSVAYLRGHQKQVEEAQKIVLLGGGAVGVQMATDIKTLFPTKDVVVVHSRSQLMPRFHPALSNIVLEKFAELEVQTELGSRAKIPASGSFEGVKQVELENGKVIEGDLIVMSTGQTPLSGYLSTLAPSAIRSDGYVAVKPTLQIDGQESGLEKIFALGDVAASGGPKAARPAMAQAKLVAENLLKLLQNSSDALDTYSPDPAAIHMTLGVIPSIVFVNPARNAEGEWEGEPHHFMKDDGRLDMGVEGVWARRAPGVTDYHL